MNKIIAMMVAVAFVAVGAFAEEKAAAEKTVTVKGTVVVVKDEAGKAASVALKADGKEVKLAMNAEVAALDGKMVEVTGVEGADKVITVKTVKAVEEKKADAPKADAPKAEAPVK